MMTVNKLQGKYEAFKEEIETFRKGSRGITDGDHSSVIEV